MQKGFHETACSKDSWTGPGLKSLCVTYILTIWHVSPPGYPIYFCGIFFLNGNFKHISNFLCLDIISMALCKEILSHFNKEIHTVSYGCDQWIF